MLPFASIVSEYAWLPVQEFASVAVIVKFDVPLDKGDPEMAPVDESVSPPGNDPVVTA